jgi:hypothetical protein
VSAKKRPWERTLEVGDVVSIRLPNGRYGALCVVHRPNDDARDFFVIDAFWEAKPSDIDHLRPMGLPRGERARPGQESVWRGSFSGRVPDDFVVVRRVELPASVRRAAVPRDTNIDGMADTVRAHLYSQWRWLHDREALEAEEKGLARKTRPRKRADTLRKMLRERPFADWRRCSPASAVSAVQAAFRVATAALIELGPNAPRGPKEKVFRQLMTELNAIDRREPCIDTGERDELIERIEALAELVGLSNADERLTGSRDW